MREPAPSGDPAAFVPDDPLIAARARPARILVVDDSPVSRRLMADLLGYDGHRVDAVGSAAQALAQVAQTLPDLVLLDVLMPDVDGFTACAQLRALQSMAAVPIVMVTSLDAKQDRVRGLEAGADDFLSKPISHAELMARVRSLLRIKRLYDEVDAQRRALEQWSQMLEQRVDEKLREIERLSRLKRFFSPRVAERLVAEDRDPLGASHRREVTVLFADLRGFTAFAERVEPERVMAMLGEFHRVMGELIFRHEGTLERFTGDGMMVFFNDPDPVDDHALRAAALACEMRAAARALSASWRDDGGPDGLGLGLSRGVATIGAIGSAERLDYAAIGLVTNRAARLCPEARADEILVCDRVWRSVCEHYDGDEAGALALKGFMGPVRAYAIGGRRC